MHLDNDWSTSLIRSVRKWTNLIRCKRIAMMLRRFESYRCYDWLRNGACTLFNGTKLCYWRQQPIIGNYNAAINKSSNILFFWISFMNTGSLVADTLLLLTDFSILDQTRTNSILFQTFNSNPNKVIITLDNLRWFNNYMYYKI